MPCLDDAGLALLRLRQQQAATDGMRCKVCTAQLWPNYCRECDEHFTDGHWLNCPEAPAKHQPHRKY